ncbi:MAG: MBL fold metallo-hydrolase [Methanosarcinaceae archaeon]|jgi:glyoxylase-like metal-dependent hydrolase (beta-lactamase superfamily II)|nr:MBL fold metallo-hydrolase [Methanosarcinaceae archaeon]NKQ39337.1 MBL fold metallo-hydrolase [Methanosarcinales archaeon]
MQVKKFNVSLYDANSYLINDRILIDTGTNANALLIEIGAQADLKNIEMIILTHCHYDHTKAAKKIAEISGASIAIHKDDADSLSDNIRSVATSFGGSAPNIKPDILLDESKEISIGNGEILKLIHTPGHTPGCICLYEENSKSLFSGDTVFPDGSVGRTDFVGGSSNMLIESIEKLMKFDVKVMYPGHGFVTDRDVNSQIKLSYHMAKSMI